MVKVRIGLFPGEKNKRGCTTAIATRIAENWRRDIGEMLRCIQYGNGFSISHLRVVVTCDRRLKCRHYVSPWDLQGTRGPIYLIS